MDPKDTPASASLAQRLEAEAITSTVCVCVCKIMIHVEIRRWHLGVDSLLPPCVTQGLNSGP